MLSVLQRDKNPAVFPASALIALSAVTGGDELDFFYLLFLLLLKIHKSRYAVDVDQVSIAELHREDVHIFMYEKN